MPDELSPQQPTRLDDFQRGNSPTPTPDLSEERVGFVEAFQTSAVRNSLLFLPALDTLNTLNNESDPQFEITPDLIDRYLTSPQGGLAFGPADLEAISDANSLSHFRALVESRLTRNALDDTLGRATGFGGTAGSLVGAFVTPDNVLLTAATAGVGAAAAGANVTARAAAAAGTANRLQRAVASSTRVAPFLTSQSRLSNTLRLAAGAGAENAAVEAALIQLGVTPEGQAADVLNAALLGGIFGGVLGGAGAGLSNLRRSVEKAAKRNAGYRQRVVDEEIVSSRLEEASRDLGTSGHPVDLHLRPLRDSGLRAPAAVLRNVLGRAAPDLLKQVEFRAAAIDGPANAVGSATRRPNGSTLITLAPTTQGGGRSVRPILTALHEVGHASFRRLSPEARGRFDGIVSDLTASGRLNRFIDEAFAGDAGADVARFRDNPRELFAEISARVSLDRYGGDSILTGSKKLANAAAAIHKSKALRPDEKAALYDLVNEASGFRGTGPKATVGELLDNQTIRNSDGGDVPLQDLTEFDPEVEFDIFDDFVPERATTFEGVIGFALNRSQDFQRSISPNVRKAGALLVRDGVGTPGRLRHEAVSEGINRKLEELNVIYDVPNQQAAARWLTAGNKRKGETRLAALDRFDREVGNALRAPDLKKLDPEVAAAVKAVRNAHDKIDQDIARSNLPEDVKSAILENTETYRTRRLSGSKLDKLSESTNGTDEAAIAWHHEAMRRRTAPAKLAEDGFDKTLRKWAEASILLQRRRRDTPTFAQSSGVALSDADIRATLSILGDVNQTDIDKVARLLSPPGDATPNFAKRKTPLDEDTVIEFEGRSISFKDIYEDRASELVNSHAKSVYRHLQDTDFRARFIDPSVDTRSVLDEAGAEVGTELVAPSPDELFRRLRESVSGQKGKARSVEERRIDDLEGTYNLIMGRNLKDVRTVDRAIRLIHAANFARVASAFGIPQIAETVSATYGYGLDAALASNSETGKIIKAATSGKLIERLASTPGLAGELLSMGIAGNAIIRRDRYFRDVIGDPEFDASRGSVDLLDRAQSGLDTINHYVSRISGMVPITVASRLRAATAAAHRLVWDMKEIEAGGKGRFVTQDRLADLGISESMRTRILDQIEAKAETSQFKGTKEKIGALNLHEWDDFEAAQSIAFALRNMAERAVQQGDLGLTARWMDSSIGALAVQFRTFGVQALANHTQSIARFQDRQAAAYAGTQAVGSALSVAVMTAARAPLQDDPTQFIKDQMNPSQFLLNSMARSGFMSVLPMFVDTAAQLTTGHTLFPGVRASGGTVGIGDFFNSNPTLQGFAAVQNAVSGAFAVPNPTRQFSKDHFSAVKALTPFGNLPGVTAVLGKIRQGLPSQDAEGDVPRSLSDLLTPN